MPDRKQHTSVQGMQNAHRARFRPKRYGIGSSCHPSFDGKQQSQNPHASKTEASGTPSLLSDLGPDTRHRVQEALLLRHSSADSLSTDPEGVPPRGS
jgi:hypothetical protein